MVYTRPESMQSTTKRHPAIMRSRMAATREGDLLAMDFEGDFNTGAYSSWGPTVANRVPVHASGPYVVPHYRAKTRAVLTHCVPAGAFRGFGVPQTVVAQEQMLDMLAEKLGLDALDFRIRNALTDTTPTVTGQVMGDGVGIRDCFEALQPQWTERRRAAEAFNAASDRFKRGVGVAGMFYGCGNTSLPNPSTIRFGLKPDGRLSLHQGAVDIGQGSNTVIAQIAADARGPAARPHRSRLGRYRPHARLRQDLRLAPDLRHRHGGGARGPGTAPAAAAARQCGRGGDAVARRRQAPRCARTPSSAASTSPACRAMAMAMCNARRRPSIRPPRRSTPMGRAFPMPSMAMARIWPRSRSICGSAACKVLRIVAAHDVGRAINPILVEGQIEGGVAQGIGMALMEEFTPGRGENLHDYLIPTIGDVPPIQSILVERASSAGPFGAKGIGEQALIPTAPAILNAIHHATGARITQIPATPGPRAGGDQGQRCP